MERQTPTRRERQKRNWKTESEAFATSGIGDECRLLHLVLEMEIGSKTKAVKEVGKEE